MNNRDNASGDVKKIKIKSVFGSKICDVIVTVIAFNYFDFSSTHYVAYCSLLSLLFFVILKRTT